jgi:hypothetical protein
MTSLSQKKLGLPAVNEGIMEAEKMCREKVTICMRINGVVKFFELKQRDLAREKIPTVFDAICQVVKVKKFDDPKFKLFRRLLVQSLFGVNKVYERDEKITPSIAHLGSFCQKNHLTEMAECFAICNECDTEFDMDVMVKLLFGAVDTKDNINKIVLDLADMVPKIMKLEEKLDLEDAESVEESSNEDKPRKRKASAKATKMLEYAIKKKNSKKSKKKQKKGKRGSSSSSSSSSSNSSGSSSSSSDSSDSSGSSSESDSESSSESADEKGNLDEKEEARLAEKAETVKKTKTLLSYESELNKFFAAVVEMMKIISLNKIFKLVVSKFMQAAKKALSTQTNTLTSKPKSTATDGDKPIDLTSVGGPAGGGEEDEDDDNNMDEDDNNEEVVKTETAESKEAATVSSASATLENQKPGVKEEKKDLAPALEAEQKSENKTLEVLADVATTSVTDVVKAEVANEEKK